jgi:hypothetical protein
MGNGKNQPVHVDGIERAKIMRVTGHKHMVMVCNFFAAFLMITVSASAQDLQDNSGPVMQATTVYPIFWLPAGFHFDTTASATADSTYEAVIQQFFADVSNGRYLNIVSQYPSSCVPPNIPNNQSCFGKINMVASPVDTHPYPHAGTVADPLQDADIQTEVTNFITQNNLTPSLNTAFFVFTGANVNECQTGGMLCTNSDFCAYHGDFAFPVTSNAVIYAFMPNVNSLTACTETINAGPNQLAADREIIAVSHELAESLTDPLVSSGPLAWYGSNGEIGDACLPWNASLGLLRADGSNVTLNLHDYVVQQLWSNIDDSCQLQLLHYDALIGSTIEYTLVTGNNALPSEAELRSNTIPLHYPGEPAWNANSTVVKVLPFSSGSTSLSLQSVNITLTSNSSPSISFSLISLDIKLRAPNGAFFCEQQGSGTPLAIITDGSAFSFPTSNCQ